MSAYAIAVNTPPSARLADALTKAPAPARPAPAADGISLVNLAARQRMLSQRMILQTVLAAAGSASHLEAARKSLQLFGDSQLRLVATAKEVDEVSSRSIKDTYTGPRGVGPLIETFMQHMRTTLQCIAQRQDHTQALGTLVASTDSVLEALNTATTTFDVLSKRKGEQMMKELSGIVSSIHTIAREAKIVSFNAQVMAARAGEHGREFAVVANVLSRITNEIDGLSREAIKLAERNRQGA
jgi:HPt (histidine-containing phosphotransfer) domain-containing protein